MSKNIITLVAGDWSGDGHEKTYTFHISSNLDQKAIKAAYQVGTKILGFDFCQKVARDYEDNILKPNYIDKLKKLGYDFESLGQLPLASGQRLVPKAALRAAMKP